MKTQPCEVCITTPYRERDCERDCGKPARINVNGFPMCAECFADYERVGLVESVEPLTVRGTPNDETCTCLDREACPVHGH